MLHQDASGAPRTTQWPITDGVGAVRQSRTSTRCSTRTPIAQTDAQGDTVPIGDVEAGCRCHASIVVPGVIYEAVLDTCVEVLELGDGALAVLLLVTHAPVLQGS